MRCESIDGSAQADIEYTATRKVAPLEEQKGSRMDEDGRQKAKRGLLLVLLVLGIAALVALMLTVRPSPTSDQDPTVPPGQHSSP